MDEGVSATNAALIGAVAAVIGGIVVAASNLLVEWLRGRRERKREEAHEERELRQAMRLVLAELSEIGTAIRQSAKAHRTWRNDRPLPAFAWREYGAILATHLPLSRWRWAEMAYNAANELNWRTKEMNRANFPNLEGPTAFRDNEWLHEPWRTVNHAMEELEGELEMTLGDARGAFGYTGYVSEEELEREDPVWDQPLPVEDEDEKDSQ